MEQAAAEPVGVVTASLIFGALILKLVDFFKYLKNGDANGIISMVMTWIAGIVAVFLILQTQWADEIKLGAESLDKLNFGSKLVLGLVASAIASYLYDVKKAVDNTDTASTPRMTAEAEENRVARVRAVLGR
jgi:EamA domain-containing membrane protein RarD